MKPRLLIGILAAAAIAVCVVMLWHDGSSPPPATPNVQATATLAPKAEPGAAAATTGAPVPVTPKPGASKLGRWKSFEELMASDIFSKQASAEDVRKFLALHGETPANLVAAYEAGQDPQWLERAEQLFPNSPVVLQALVTSKLQPEKLAERIERFKAADPNNPLPWVFSAERMFQAGDPGARAEIEAALSRPGFYTYTNERMASAKALYESMGWTPLEAEMRSTFGLAMPQMQSAVAVGRGLMELEKTTADGGDQAQADHLVQLTYGLGKMFSLPEASRTLVGQLVGYSLERKALAAMPAEQVLPDGGTAGARIAEIERVRNQNIALSKDLEVRLGGNPDLTAEYARQLRQYGEGAALRWLKQRK